MLESSAETNQFWSAAMKIWSCWLVLSMMLWFTRRGLNAEAARRLGGGGSVRPAVEQRDTIARPRRTLHQPPRNRATAPCRRSRGRPPRHRQRSRPSAPGAPCWAAWLRAWAWPGWPSSLGLGAKPFGQFMMFALLVLVAMLAIGWFMRSRRPAQPGGNSPFAFQGAGGGAAASEAPPTYRPEHVGNDASARPLGAQPGIVRQRRRGCRGRWPWASVRH